MTLDQATDKIYAALEKLGPQAAEVALTVGRGAAAKQLIYGCLFIGIASALGKGSGLLWRKSKTMKQGSEYSDYEFPLIGSVIIAVVSGIMSIIGLFQLLDPLAWIGLFNPAAFLAQKFLP